MAGKGDKRRPQQISEAELTRRWQLAFDFDAREDAEDVAEIERRLAEEGEDRIPWAEVLKADADLSAEVEGGEA